MLTLLVGGLLAFEGSPRLGQSFFRGEGTVGPPWLWDLEGMGVLNTRAPHSVPGKWPLSAKCFSHPWGTHPPLHLPGSLMS